MKMSYGAYYKDAHRGTRHVDLFYGTRKMRSGRYLVYEIHTGQMHDTYPTKRIAYYVACRLNGKSIEETNALLAKVEGL